MPALKKAMDAGIKVVTYDSDTAPEGRDVFINQASAEDLGRTQVQLLAKQIGHKGARSRSCPPRRTRRTRTPGSSS